MEGRRKICRPEIQRLDTSAACHESVFYYGCICYVECISLQFTFCSGLSELTFGQYALFQIKVFWTRNSRFTRATVGIIIKLVQMCNVDPSLLLVQISSKIFEGVKVLSYPFNQLRETRVALGACSTTEKNLEVLEES